MEKRKRKFLVIAFISILTFTMGCGITITRNNYYSYPDQSEIRSENNEARTEDPADTLTNIKNERK